MLLLLLGIIFLHGAGLVLLFVSTIVSVSMLPNSFIHFKFLSDVNLLCLLHVCNVLGVVKLISFAMMLKW